MELTTTIIAALVMAVGIAGLIVPALPGLLLVLGGVLIWALGNSGPTAWTVFGIACVLAAVGYVVQYVVPGRHLGRAGIPKRSSLVGVIFGVIGFFVIPVIGMLVGFVLGVFVAEMARQRRTDEAWRSTKVAVKAALMSVGIELLAALIIAVGWACVAIPMAL